MNRHDKGPHFPCIISLQGVPGKTNWLLTTPTGTAQTASYEVAAALAEAYNERQKNLDILFYAGGGKYEYSGCVANEADDGTTDVSAGYPEDEAEFIGIYARDVDGHAVWLADVDDSVQAEIVIGYLRNLPCVTN